MRRWLDLLPVTTDRVSQENFRRIKVMLEEIARQLSGVQGEAATGEEDSSTLEHNTLSGRSAAGCHPATAISVDTSNFGQNLTDSADTVQEALEEIDNLELVKTEYSFYGSAVGAGVTSVDLGMDGGLLVSTEPGVPMPSAGTLSRIAVSFRCDNVPVGDWTVTIEKRPFGGSFSVAGTFQAHTS